MPLPKYNELYIPLLTAIQDGNIYTMKEIKAKVSQAMSLTEEELSERLPRVRRQFTITGLGGRKHT